MHHADQVPGSDDRAQEPKSATAPEPSSLGSGSAAAPRAAWRLRFAGSASTGTEVPPADAGAATLGGPPRVPLPADAAYHLSLFGGYSSKFSFARGCGLPGRVHAAGVPAWERHVARAPSHLFERRGGAMQFGITTALGLPVCSHNVGRIVLVLYSRHDREKDEGLALRMVRDFQGLNPCPRWRLMVDVGNAPDLTHDPLAAAPSEAPRAQSGSANAMESQNDKDAQTLSLVSLRKFPLFLGHLMQMDS